MGDGGEIMECLRKFVVQIFECYSVIAAEALGGSAEGLVDVLVYIA